MNFDKLHHKMLKSRSLVVFLVWLFFGYFGKSSSCVTSYQDALDLFALLLRFDKQLFYSFMF